MKQLVFDVIGIAILSAIVGILTCICISPAIAFYVWWFGNATVYDFVFFYAGVFVVGCLFGLGFSLVDSGAIDG